MRELEKERVRELLESSGSKGKKKGEDVLCGGYTCVERSFWNQVMGIRVWWTKCKRRKKEKKRRKGMDERKGKE